MHKVNFHLETLTCPGCLQTIQDDVVNLEGIVKESLEIFYTGSCVQLDFDSNVISVEDIKSVLNNSSCEVLEFEIEPYIELVG